MSNTLRNTTVATTTHAADAFLSASRIYLDSIERLSALNLNTARALVEDCAAATQSLAGAKVGGDPVNLLAGLGQPMWEKALTHWRSTYELVAKTNDEMSKVIVGQFSQPNMSGAGMAGWGAMSEIFKQFTEKAAESMAEATEARVKMMSVTRPDTKKTA